MFKIILAFALTLTISFAEILKIGDNLTPFTLSDQFDKEHTINSDKYQTFLISFSKDTSAKVNEFLQNKEKNFLEKNKIVYISDIHKMPSIITYLFGLPKMKKYDYNIILMYEENKIFPQSGESLTVVRFKDNKVNSIEFVTEDEKIETIFH